MFFKKQKRMVDIRELQKRGVVRIPRNDVVVPTNREGFVEFGNNGEMKPEENTTAPSTNTELFGFQNTSSSEPSDQFPTQSDGYDKREVDAKIIELDNKIYKLEQRIELVEKKLDISQPAQSDGNLIGW